MHSTRNYVESAADYTLLRRSRCGSASTWPLSTKAFHSLVNRFLRSPGGAKFGKSSAAYSTFAVGMSNPCDRARPLVVYTTPATDCASSIRQVKIKSNRQQERQQQRPLTPATAALSSTQQEIFVLLYNSLRIYCCALPTSHRSSGTLLTQWLGLGKWGDAAYQY
jgi:hypothetical protein